MDCYIIPPNTHLELSNFGNRFFCLAQHYLRDERVRAFFKRKVQQGKWVTLDNGVGDHEPVTPDQLFEAMIDLRPSEIILPDVLYDGFKTLTNAEDFLDRIERFIKNLDDSLESDALHYFFDKLTIFFCPQGKDKDEWMRSYMWALQDPRIHTIGMSKLAIPYALNGIATDQTISEARQTLFKELKEKNYIRKPLHFLGAQDPFEFVAYKDEPLVRSTDSCFSILAGMNEKKWPQDVERISTPKDYFYRPLTRNQYDIATQNAHWFNMFTKSLRNYEGNEVKSKN